MIGGTGLVDTVAAGLMFSSSQQNGLSETLHYIYNLDSYCFKIGTLISPRGGKSFQGGANAPPPLKKP